jgi:diketogulonate reductase-like aldo/keto reductase
MAAPSVTLNDGNSIPAVGLGVFQIPPAETEQAAAYRNERETGRAVADSDVPRDQLYVVTKLWNTDQGRDGARQHAGGIPRCVKPAWTGSRHGHLWARDRCPSKVNAVAERCGRTPAQVLIRWHIQPGNIVIPKSVDPTRIASNLDVFDFELSATEMASISSLDDGTRLGPNPRPSQAGE